MNLKTCTFVSCMTADTDSRKMSSRCLSITKEWSLFCHFPFLGWLKYLLIILEGAMEWCHSSFGYNP